LFTSKNKNKRVRFSDTLAFTIASQLMIYQFLLSDLHLDSKRCRHDALKRFLDRAIETDALVL
jgi:hypothetical protein